MAMITRIASDGKPITMTDTVIGGKMKLGIIMPAMERDEARAGKTVTVEPFWAVTYDEHGYAVKCEHVGGEGKANRAITFINETVEPEYSACTAVSEDFVNYTIYDGKQNYIAKVNVATGETELNVGNKEDAELMARAQSYVDAFLGK